MMRHRLAIIASHVIQYQDPFFRLLAAEPEIDLTVFYCSPQGAIEYRDEDMKTTLRWDIETLSGYRSVMLRNFAPRADGFFRHVNPGVIPALARDGYDAALFMTGWGSLTPWLGFLACRLWNVPILLYGDSSFVPPEDTMPRRLRALVMRALMRATSGFMISGAWNADYYRHYGADPSRFFPLPWAVDNERFANAARIGAEEGETLRARYGVAAGRMLIAYSGKLIARKDPLALLRAFERMRLRDRAALLFIGDGELRGAIEEYARAHALGDVAVTGFVNQEAIPALYGMSDVFVLPSSFDPRATVVNEAMACGLPVIVTDRCGPAGDIVRHGDNGFVFRFGDVDALAAHLDALASDAELRRRMSERSRQIIAAWDYRAGVEGVKEALRAVEARR
jgi:glycosyltransferase involved in cell wall biosynthesis